MMNQHYKSRFIERILHLIQLLDENHLELDQILEDGLPSGQFSTQMETELQTALECISFMDEIPGGFFIYYADGEEQIIYANRGVLRMFLCDTMKEFRELTGNSFKGIVHPDDLEEVEDSIRAQLLSNQYDLDYVEYRIRRKDGSTRQVEDYGHLVERDSARNIFCVFLGGPSERQILQQTRQMRQMQALAETFEKADLDVKAKNTFLSQISHEMRTPLNAIFGFTTLAQISLDEPDTIADYLGQIETASHQLLNMITQALDFSALSNAIDSTDEECDLCDALKEVYNKLLPKAKENDLIFSLNCEKVTHRSVYTASDRLQQMVHNLAINAITYTQPGGRVDVILTEDKILQNNISSYRLEVRDTGIGMAESFIEHIFEPFTREKPSTISEIRGIGLGLTIVKSIVNLLGGTISVKTALNKGSTFTVTLPFRVSLDTSAEEETLPMRILVVEDNEINLEIETEILQRNGFAVDPVDGGRKAFEKVKNASPTDYALILMDLQMPDMNGWQVASAIRSLPNPALAHIPIIALSANVQLEDRRRSLESGIDVHLPKPMDIKLLLETIQKILSNATR